MIDAAHAGGVTPFAYSAELVNQNHTAKPYAFFDLDVAADLAVIAHDNFVFKNAVVADMHAYHQQILVAYNGVFIFVHTCVNGDIFPKDIIVSNEQPADFAVEKIDVQLIGMCAQCQQQEDSNTLASIPDEEVPQQR